MCSNVLTVSSKKASTHNQQIFSIPHDFLFHQFSFVTAQTCSKSALFRAFAGPKNANNFEQRRVEVWKSSLVFDTRKTEMNYAAWMFGLLKLQTEHDQNRHSDHKASGLTCSYINMHQCSVRTSIWDYFWGMSPESKKTIKKGGSSNTRPFTSLKFMRLPSLRERRFGIACHRFHVHSPRGENTEKGEKYGKVAIWWATLHQPNTCQ